MTDSERELLTLEPIHAPRIRERYDVSPAWVLHHLLQHEAEHRSHIAWLRDTYPGQAEGDYTRL